MLKGYDNSPSGPVRTLGSGSSSKLIGEYGLTQTTAVKGGRNYHGDDDGVGLTALEAVHTGDLHLLCSGNLIDPVAQ